MTFDSVQIECFLSAAKHLNFSKAADFLYISQPVLSRRISKLEQELGVKLFNRTSRGLELTDEGKMFEEFFLRTTKEFNALIEKVNKNSDIAKRRIRIGVCEGIDLSKYIRVILSEFKKEKNNIEVEFDSGPVETLLESFKYGYYDLVIMLKVTIENYVKNSVVCDVEIKDFINVNKCVVYSEHNPVSKNKNPKLEDFSGQTLLCLKKEHVPQRVLSHGDLFEKHKMSPNVRFLPNMDSIYMALQIGDGFSVFDNHERILNSDDILHFDLEETQYISFVCHETQPKFIADFVSFCLDVKF